MYIHVLSTYNTFTYINTYKYTEEYIRIYNYILNYSLSVIPQKYKFIKRVEGGVKMNSFSTTLNCVLFVDKHLILRGSLMCISILAQYPPFQQNVRSVKIKYVSHIDFMNL
jgi:hypothetical protein